MNILVTGGCGFIGSHIVEHHMAKGDHVQVIDDLSTGSLDNIRVFINNPKFKFDKADILTWPGLQKAVVSATRIYHMAAIIGIYRVIAEPFNVFSTNILGCERLLRTIHQTKSRPWVMIASSSSVYGHGQSELLSENNDLIIKAINNPLSGYAISKIFAEKLGLAYFTAANIPVTLIRFFNIIGPRQIGRYGMVVPRFIRQSCQDESITVYGDGSQTRSFCDVRDAVSALELLANNDQCHGEIINIGQDSEISINDLAHLIQKKTDSRSKIKYVPYREAYGMDLTDIKQRRPDLTKLSRLTGFTHQWPLEKSIDNLASFYMAGEKY